jgi:hypothetical protein
MLSLPVAILIAVPIAGLFISLGVFFGLKRIAIALPESFGKISGALMELSNGPKGKP